jgi:acyl-coenzyme A synthetase/AMP-(fatty) acid ligase
MYILSQVIDSTKLLTDGKLICSYQEIPQVFEKLEKVFAERKINQKDCLVLETENSVPIALVLLFLLEKGYSFLLVPKPENSKPFVPKFCRYRIATESLTEKVKAVDLIDYTQILQVVENEAWNGETASSIPKLYMRTSGSTGKPKMVVHSHEKLLGNILNCVERLQLNSEDKIAIPVPIFHMYGLGAGFLPGVAAGASIDLQKGANLLRYLQREKEFEPNVAFMTPIFCEILLKGRKSPRPYRMTVAAGDRVREDTFSKYESKMGPLVKLYGSTEMGAMAAASPADSRELRARTVGQPMTGAEMRVARPGKFSDSDVAGASRQRLDKESVSVEGMEDAGLLWCRYKYGFEGYIDENGSPTGESVRDGDGDGWFCTKDLGRIWPEERVEVLGRADHSINRDGLLVFFSDVEKAMEKVEGIDSVVVVSKGESQRGKGLVAYCVPARGAKLGDEEIRVACFDLLPRRAVPDRVSVVASLPMLPNGKVDRQKLVGLE